MKTIHQIALFEVQGQYPVRIDKITRGFVETTYRVSYGADISQCATLEAAYTEFKYKVEHSMTCAGQLEIEV